MTNLMYFLAGLVMGVFFERSFRLWIKDQEQPKPFYTPPPKKFNDHDKIREEIRTQRLKQKPDRAAQIYWQETPHTFRGRTDRDCETCGQPDRFTIHHIESYTR